MEGMSERQEDVYTFIKKYCSEKGYSPSFIDIAEGLGLSNSTVAIHIEALRKKGYVTSEYGTPRTLKAVPA